MVNELRWFSSAGAIIIGTEQLLLLTKGDGEHDVVVVVVVQISQLLMSFRRVFDFDRRFFLVDDLTAVNFSTPLFFTAIEDLKSVLLEEEEVVVGPSSSCRILMLLLASTAASGVLATRPAAAGDFPGVLLNIFLTSTMIIITER